MSVIATLIEPHRVTRVFFDCYNAAPDPMDQRRIEQAIEHSIALDQADDDASEMLKLAALQTSMAPRMLSSETLVPGLVTKVR